MLDYLSADMDTVKGQNERLEDSGKGAFSFIILEHMPRQEVSVLREKIEGVDHVETVLWYDSLLDLSVPWSCCHRTSTTPSTRRIPR